ncbi:MAG: type II toxin-antitoxin system VapC family toxin [Desulfovermiculus sp.]|nr:type II toxin-antitoxin system VapC family toxin [Desulfovermiculus sp.]
MHPYQTTYYQSLNKNHAVVNRYADFYLGCFGQPQVDLTARETILGADDVVVSAASIWEISIKTKLGKLEGNPAEFVEAIGLSGFRELKICSAHAAKVHQLPLHHRDPFDRLLIAQAIVEPMRFLTADSLLAQYSELVMTVTTGRL